MISLFGRNYGLNGVLRQESWGKLGVREKGIDPLFGNLAKVSCQLKKKESHRINNCLSLLPGVDISCSFLRTTLGTHFRKVACDKITANHRGSWCCFTDHNSMLGIPRACSHISLIKERKEKNGFLVTFESH